MNNGEVYMYSSSYHLKGHIEDTFRYLNIVLNYVYFLM